MSESAPLFFLDGDEGEGGAGRSTGSVQPSKPWKRRYLGTFVLSAYSMTKGSDYIQPGDRACACHGDMEPVGVEQSGKKGWVIVHRCRKCGFTGRNRAALDDPQQPDDWNALVALSARRD